MGNKVKLSGVHHFDLFNVRFKVCLFFDALDSNELEECATRLDCVVEFILSLFKGSSCGFRKL